MDELGKALREVRLRRGLSLRAVAAAADISPSLLSQVETGKTQPSVGTLYALVSVLETSIDKLLNVGPGPLEEEQPVPNQPSRKSLPSPIQRGEDNPKIVMEHGVTWERLAADGSGAVDVLRTTYEPGATSSSERKFMRHSGVEYAYLIEGKLTLRLDFDTYELRAGDSLCFDSQRPHMYENRTNAVARGIWFVIGRNQDQHRAPEQRGPGTGLPVRSAIEAWDALGQLPQTAPPSASEPMRDGPPSVR